MRVLIILFLIVTTSIAPDRSTQNVLIFNAEMLGKRLESSVRLLVATESEDRPVVRPAKLSLELNKHGEIIAAVVEYPKELNAEKLSRAIDLMFPKAKRKTHGGIIHSWRIEGNFSMSLGQDDDDEPYLLIVRSINRQLLEPN